MVFISAEQSKNCWTHGLVTFGVGVEWFALPLLPLLLLNPELIFNEQKTIRTLCQEEQERCFQNRSRQLRIQLVLHLQRSKGSRPGALSILWKT